MAARAQTSVFWPNMYEDLETTRNNCRICRQIAPSNPKLPPHEPPALDFPFQQVCSDYMTLNGTPYLITVDRLTGWPDVRRAKNEDAGGSGLVKLLRELFMSFGIPEELTSDGGPEFTASETQSFLRKYGVQHRISSVGNPHSNQRSKAGVKSMKRALRGNTGANGSLDVDNFAKATLQYRNNPLQSTGISPAIALFGHPIRDFLPMMRSSYAPAIQWAKKIATREKNAAKASDREHEKWSI